MLASLVEDQDFQEKLCLTLMFVCFKINSLQITQDFQQDNFSSILVNSINLNDISFIYIFIDDCNKCDFKFFAVHYFNYKIFI